MFGSEFKSTDLADEGKGLAPDPLWTVAEPDGELVDEVQTQVISTACVQLLEDLYNLSRYGEATGLKKIKYGGLCYHCSFSIFGRENVEYLTLKALKAILDA